MVSLCGRVVGECLEACLTVLSVMAGRQAFKALVSETLHERERWVSRSTTHRQAWESSPPRFKLTDRLQKNYILVDP
jgi:hypothetical protein